MLHPMHLFDAQESLLPPPSWPVPTQDASRDETVVVVVDPENMDFGKLLRPVVHKGLRHEENIIWQFPPLNSQSNDIRLLALVPAVGETVIRCKHVNFSLVDNGIIRGPFLCMG